MYSCNYMQGAMKNIKSAIADNEKYGADTF